MKNQSISRIFCLVSGLVGMGSAGADEKLAVIGAGPRDGLTFTTTCSPNSYGQTQAYFFQIEGKTANRPFVAKMSVTKNGVTKSVNDPTNGNGQPGPFGSLAAGDGVYTVVLSKELRPGETSTNGNMQVGVTSHCQAANGGHTNQEMGAVVPIQIPDPGPGPGPDPKPPQPAPGTPGFTGSLTNKIDERRFALTCEAKKGVDTQLYRARIKGTNKKSPYQMKLSIWKDGQEVETIDPDNSDKLFSEWAELPLGNGVYVVKISKYSEAGLYAGSNSYSVKNECLAANGSRTKIKGPKKLP
jgi:hypothetical protein